MANGVRYTTILDSESQEQFCDKLCKLYKDFYHDFIEDSGKYYALYRTLSDYFDDSDGENRRLFFSQVLTLNTNIYFMVSRFSSLLTTVPIPDVEYFTMLYSDLQKSDRSRSELDLISEEFSTAMQELNKGMSAAFDKFREIEQQE